MTTKAKLNGKPAVEVVMAGLPKERTMTETKPCETGKHCERQARDLGACVAGMCFPPAPVEGIESGSLEDCHGAIAGGVEGRRP
jgi:hypothetical protein